MPLPRCLARSARGSSCRRCPTNPPPLSPPSPHGSSARCRAPADELTIVGSSLGGYYATHLAERCGARAVLINPAVRPFDDLAPFAGTQTNLYTGEAFEVIEAHFAELRALRVARITRPERYFLLVRTGDEILDWREAVAFYGARGSTCGRGDHGWADRRSRLEPGRTSRASEANRIAARHADARPLR